MSDHPDYSPISCALHDHLELACMGGYRLKIELTDGRQMHAVAQTTQSGPQQAEWLIVTAENGLREAIRLDRIAAITAETGPQAGRRLPFTVSGANEKEGKDGSR